MRIEKWGNAFYTQKGTLGNSHLYNRPNEITRLAQLVTPTYWIKL